MPTSKSKDRQNEEEFMRKCLNDESMGQEFPDQKQRAAVCFNQMKRQKAEASSLDWEDASEDSYIIY